jgi:lysophospholipase L1-like esterase
MDDLKRFPAPKEKAAAELVPGKVGKAIHFRFDKDARSVFFTGNVRGTPEWDRAAGLSFWVKGDGTDGLGALQFIYDNDFAVRYDVAFPVKGTDWRKVTVAWADLTPTLPGPKAKPLGGPGGNPPSKLSALWVGKWWYWGPDGYPPVSFALDEIRLEPAIDRPKAAPPAGDPLARVREKLTAGKPVTVVTMGDSLTDYRHWANRKVNWPTLLTERAKAKHGSKVTVVNPAIGGTQLTQNLVLVPRWLEKAPEPDLVTVCFGGNDWDAMEPHKGWGPDDRRAWFRQWAGEAVDRVRRATQGKADVLLLTTVPGLQRWDTYAPLAEGVRLAAKDRDAGLADTFAAFHAAGSDEKARPGLFEWDKVHLGKAGHEAVAAAVLKAVEAGGK